METNCVQITSSNNLNICRPDALHVQQKIQFEKFAAQLLPSTVMEKSAQLSCYMEHCEFHFFFKQCIWVKASVTMILV